MTRFFDKFFSDTCHVDGMKMKEVAQIINSRDESLSFSLPDFIVLLGDKFIEIEEIAEAIEDEDHLNFEHLQHELEISRLRISLMMCMLAEYFYPIIEYVQKISSDGIRNEPKKTRRLGTR